MPAAKDYAPSIEEKRRWKECICRTNRILMAVSAEYVLSNPDDAKDLTTLPKLVSDLIIADHQYLHALQLRGVSKQRRRKNERGIKAAQYLKKLHNEDPIFISDDRGIVKLDPSYFITKLDACIFQLRARCRDARSSQIGFEWSVERLHVHQRSAFEWLTGVELPRIFEQHLSIEAKVERNSGRDAEHRPPGGPYIRFARQFLIEFGIHNRDGQPYSDEAIAKALTSARSGRRRRKG